MKTPKTTAAGILAGLGLVVSTLAQVAAQGGGGFAAAFKLEHLGQLVAAAGVISLGWFAKDSPGKP